jgi:dTDP-4-dehydrorhamnose 3,5-epimerase
VNVIEQAIAGVLLIQPKVFQDDRGFFVEQFRAERYAEAGIIRPFVQDNLSRSTKGVWRGLHFQAPYPQAKMVSVPHGRVRDVAVDLRVGSPTYRSVVAVELSSEGQEQLYVPRGCAHGFCVLSDWALLHYKCDQTYRPDCDRGVRYDDPQIGVPWPKMDVVLSPKDAGAPLLQEINPETLPRFSAD